MSSDETGEMATRRLRAISRAENPKRHVRAHLSSAIAKVDACIRAYPGNARPETILSSARELNLFKFQPSRVRLWAAKKLNGGYRPVCALPPRLQAAHLMIGDVLRAITQPAPFIYDARGRGRDREVLSVRALIESGFRWCFVADVRSCFQMVRPDALYSLPLPRSVIRSVLDTRELRFNPQITKEEREGKKIKYPVSLLGFSMRDIRKGQLGIMPGASSSSAILHYFWRQMGLCLPQGCYLFVFVDDLIVVAKTKSVCEEAERTLRRYFDQHPAGPFGLSGAQFDARDGFGLLGYLLYADAKDVVAVIPSDAAYKRLCERYAKIRSGREPDPRVGLETMLRNFSAGYRASTIDVPAEAAAVLGNSEKCPAFAPYLSIS